VKIDPSAINSPLALIALFVAIIELFLLYPITQLGGWDRSLLVIFIIAYPVFIATAFFIFLWNKPVNLYTPHTLSVDLQQALLPDKLLAPDRAAVTAVELKITALETQIREVTQQIQSNAGMIAATDVAKLSDLDALKNELLSRAEAAGDVSRRGLASAARELQLQATEETDARIALANEQLPRFKAWIEKHGLEPVSIPIPRVVGEDSGGPYIGPSSSAEPHITLGPEKSDYTIPGLFIYFVAKAKDYHLDFVDGRGELVWVVCEFMSCRFGNLQFPSNYLLREVTSGRSKIVKIYRLLYKLFSRLIDGGGSKAVQAGIVRMINHWNSQSTVGSSLSSIVEGMSEQGGDAKTLSGICGEYLRQIAAISVESD
jgi:hypothetical protein